MRQRTRKPWYLKLVKPNTKAAREYYGNAFCVLAICLCGHVAEIPNAYRNSAGDTTYPNLRPRPKRSRCGGRAPRLETYTKPTL